MYFRSLSLMLLLLTQIGFAQARKPAVEDFVGIEIDHPEVNPQGTEALFNFEKDIHQFEANKGRPLKAVKADPSFETSPDNLTTAMAIAFILGLPAMIWFMMMNHLRQKAYAESASNLEVLEEYRKKREKARKAQEDYKKVS